MVGDLFGAFPFEGMREEVFVYEGAAAFLESEMCWFVVG